MNVEEERKAFEKTCPMPEGVNITNAEYFKMYRDAQFEIWVKAKEHATEMAKTQVVIKMKGPRSEPSSYPWIVKTVSGPCPGVLEDFRTEEDAVEWATNCGYRRVTE